MGDKSPKDKEKMKKKAEKNVGSPISSSTESVKKPKKTY